MKYAARVTDLHVCGLPFHVGGAILPPGEAKVLVGGPASARFADRAACLVGAPDAIIQAASTVLIGGLPAARQADATVHPGAITGGLPTVLIGDPSVTGAQMKTPSGKLTNTYVAHDKTHNRLFVVSYLEYHGAGATNKYANDAKAQIEQMWSGTHTVRGKSTEVTVQVRTSVNPTGTATPGYDRIEVKTGTGRSNQTLGGGPGTQHTGDANPGNFVAAHEYGHTLGIEDQYKDTPTGSVPDPAKTSNLTENIMAQTWPDSTTGNDPHPYEEHYNTMLDTVGL